uniref:Uncharacterized protein n=1 Tax=Glossina brevipalpis TaxID=37001 RepID=A0A1A9WN53_9MUSC
MKEEIRAKIYDFPIEILAEIYSKENLCAFTNASNYKMNYTCCITPRKFNDPNKQLNPLFCIDICNAYFCVIIGIRMYLDSDNKRKALHRFLWSTYFLFLVAIFKYLLCLKLTGQTGLEYSEVFSPIFVLLQLVAVRACQLPNSI